MRSFYLIPLILTNIGAIKVDSVKEVFSNTGDVNLALLTRNGCNDSTALMEREEFFVNSAIWTVHQFNYLEVVPQLDFGLSIYKTCNEKQEYQTIFDLFQRHDEQFLLGLVADFRLSSTVQRFTEALDLDVRQTVKCPIPLIKASVALLGALNWVENVTVVAPNDIVVEEFSKIAKKEWICIKNYIVYNSAIPVKNSTSENVVVFGDHNSLTSFWQNSDTSNTILVPLDSSVLKATPENSYVITLNYHEQLNYTPNPSLFEIAAPLVVYAQNLKHFITGTCNDTTDKLKCLRNKFQGTPQSVLRPSQIADLLKIETSSINYYVYKSENSSLPRKIFSYNIFSNNLTLLDNTVELGNASEPGCKSDPSSCQKQCKNFASRSSVGFIPGDCEIRIRSESWVFAFLSLSLLGVLFCIAILIFLLVSICRRNVLEGNPVLTMLLLVAVMLMFCSILPLSLEGDKSTKESICLARALAITLSFSAAFSLILSRSILLATASKEIGFMSHVAGPVQSFLCLFIFGVQAALSLQVVNRCSDIFRGYSFVYLLSYNAMLLLLLLCLCPLIVKCQRNYKEGKYFTWAVATISVLWCVWIPAYALVDQQYKDSVLCFGLVSTASALMATIFVPRTYLMTIAAARDKITSTLPSLSGATSAMDIYRAGAQPVYDCVNVAAINAVTVARAGVTPIQQPDLYSCPNLPEDDDFDVRCATPIDDDKVTRF